MTPKLSASRDLPVLKILYKRSHREGEAFTACFLLLQHTCMVIPFYQIIFLNMRQWYDILSILQLVLILAVFHFLTIMNAASKTRTKFSGFLVYSENGRPVCVCVRVCVCVWYSRAYSSLVQMVSDISTSLSELVISCLFKANPAGWNQHLTDCDVTGV